MPMNELEKITLDIDSTKKRITKGLMSHLGIIMGSFLVFAFVVVMTTDISIVSFEEITSLGLDFFLLVFCSYAVYVCCADSGTKSGLATQTYTDMVEKFDVMKKAVVDGKMQTKMIGFCHHYISDELRSARMATLSVVGFDYEEYQEKYMRLSEEEVDAIPGLTAPQKKAIKKANRVKPIKLTPEMILRRGGGTHRRAALDVNPSSKKTALFVTKFVQIIVVSLLMSMIALEAIVEPTRAVFASICLKMISLVSNGFAGYKVGYENVVIDTVSYMSSQLDLMQQGVQYIEESSEKRNEISLLPSELNTDTTKD